MMFARCITVCLYLRVGVIPVCHGRFFSCLHSTCKFMDSSSLFLFTFSFLPLFVSFSLSLSLSLCVSLSLSLYLSISCPSCRQLLHCTLPLTALYATRTILLLIAEVVTSQCPYSFILFTVDRRSRPNHLVKIFQK